MYRFVQVREIGTVTNFSQIIDNDFFIRSTNKWGYSDQGIDVYINDGPAPSFQFGQGNIPNIYFGLVYNTGVLSVTGATSVYLYSSQYRTSGNSTTVQTGLTFGSYSNYCTIAGTPSGVTPDSRTITIRATNT